MTHEPVPDTPTPASPRAAVEAEYARRLAERRALLERLRRRDRGLAAARLAVAGAAIVLVWLVATRALPVAWLLAPGAVFAALVIVHDRVLAAARRAERAVAIYHDGLERLAGRWPGRGPDGQRFLAPEHPYAANLDVFGRGSLFELLCRAQTSGGQERLARFLLEPAGPAVVRLRQQAASELRPLLDFREELGLAAAATPSDAQDLGRWALEPRRLGLAHGHALARGLAFTAMAALVAWLAGLASSSVFLAALVAVALFGFALRGELALVLGSVERAAGELRGLATILRLVEERSFESAALVALAGGLRAGGEPPSQALARLERLVVRLDSLRNPLYIPFAKILLADLRAGFAIEAWRARFGPALPGWIGAASELEALASLASHAYESPEDVLPELVDEGPLVRAEGLGHPLIPLERQVRNDIALGRELRLLIVSGSNMSGKTTLLRSLGVSVVLALAGAVVRARRLELSPLAVGASIRVHDSLLEGSSRFYAEIKRLRQILDLTAGPLPVLFLLDEVLHGTNSHDRLAGAEALARALIERGAVGLITTHDLTLARIADDYPGKVVNVHFADELVDGRLRFDYTMRPGVVTRSNAIELMRSVGLDV